MPKHCYKGDIGFVLNSGVSVRIATMSQFKLNDIFYGFTQSLWANDGVFCCRLRLILSKYLPDHCLLITFPFNDILFALTNKQRINTSLKKVLEIS
jgi:hypothetical protein